MAARLAWTALADDTSLSRPGAAFALVGGIWGYFGADFGTTCCRRA